MQEEKNTALTAFLATLATEDKADGFDATVRMAVEAKKSGEVWGVDGVDFSIPSLPSLPQLSVSGVAEPLRGEGSVADLHSDLVLLEMLGEGGMGQVFLARQQSLGREVAIKRIKSPLLSEQKKRTLLQEGYVMGYLEHPNITPVHAMGRDDTERPLIVMKRIEGVPWKVLIHQPEHAYWKAHKGGAEERLLRHIGILMEVCDAVRYAHSKGILHLDIKPDNVMVGAFGEVYLLDWGLARRYATDDAGRSVIRAESLSGTPGYMAPEMVSGWAIGEGTLGPCTDVYLLGATLHEVLTQSPRHVGKTLSEALLSVCASEAVVYAPDIPRELGEICNKATHPDPAARFVDVASFQEALRAYLSHRDSTLLSDEASQGLAQLRRWWGQEGDLDEETYRAMYRQFYECIFGFQQALRRWGENLSAFSALQDCLTGMIRFDVRKERLEEARRLYAELPVKEPTLWKEIEVLEERLAAREREQAALRQMAYEMDPTVSRGVRLGFTVALATVPFLFLLVFSRVWADESAFTNRSSLLLISVVLVLLLGGVVLWRRSILANAFSRRFFALLVWTMSLVFVQRLVGTLQGVPVAWVIMADLLLVSAVLGAASITVLPRFGGVAGVALLGALALAAFPAWFFPIMFTTIAAIFGLLAYLAWRGES